MKRISVYWRESILLALIICAIGISSKWSDEIGVPETAFAPHASNGQLDEECRLKMAFVNESVQPFKQMSYADSISWPLPLVYRVSEDRRVYLLTCRADHHKGLFPVTTGRVFLTEKKSILENGYGLAKGPIELELPFSDYQKVSRREFLGIPRFSGSYAVHRMGRFNVLVHVSSEPEDEDYYNIFVLNPDDELKKIQEGRLGDAIPQGWSLSEEDRAAIIRKYRIEDPFVLERLNPEWDPTGFVRAQRELNAAKK